MAQPHALLVHPPEGTARIESSLEEAGCRVTTVESATSALAELVDGGVDCLITEHSLPGDGGLSLLEAVQEVAPTLPVVVYADVDGELTAEAYDGGADRVVKKNGAESVATLTDEVERATSEGGPYEEARDVTEHEPDPEDIVRAIDDASIGISLSDPSLPDNPIVYVNDAWQDITGYRREQILGRNPRLMQGPGTDPKAVESLAIAIENEESVTVELNNYRPDGTPWWNELTVAPVHDDDGELVHYVGFQKDVSERRAARELAEERAERLAAETRALNRILERVNGLVNELTRILAEEHDRRMIAHRVCDEIVSARGYTAAWIGSTTATDDRLELTATAGLHEELDEQLALDRLPDAVAEAVESEAVVSQDVGAPEADALDPGSVGARRCAVVPLTYGQRRYGLLGVYGEGKEALDAREQDLFGSIGKMIATRLSAIETSQVLTADRVVEVEIAIGDDAFPLAEFAGAIGSDVEYVGMTGVDGRDGCELFVNAEAGRDVAELTTLPAVEDVRVVAETDAAMTVAVTVASATPFLELADHGAAVSGAEATPGGATLVLELPLEHDVRSVLDVLSSRYDGVELRSRVEHDRRDRTPHEFAADLDGRLTDRQRTTLETAQMNGYFEWPRPTDGEEIAEKMGITRQTFHQHLRAAERKLVDAYVAAGNGANGVASVPGNAATGSTSVRGRRP